ncbi:MAG TPA: Stp1/IreP family PP2C-type Ser/Thr phosphatase [Thermoanaerobaculia bacterium]|nr:Stp1/IreP family PP2C-type Ser/Thr phosphatase [Thermoanaerobaculia bacterium]
MRVVESFGLSDVGRARTHNEDCFEIDPRLGLFLVADGMGGHRYGEVASRVAVKAIREFVAATEDSDSTWPFAFDTRLRRHSNLLKTAVRVAHDRVLSAIRTDRRLFGMGTTVVGIYIDADVAAVAHVGDSRAYRLRDGRLELLTQDHTWVNEQVVAGHLSEHQARSHPLKNVVTRALGGEREVEVDLQEVPVQPGDLYLLCSDGLTTMLADVEIAREAAAGGGMQAICERLIGRANSRGGHDNVTVVAVAIADAAREDAGDATVAAQRPASAASSPVASAAPAAPAAPPSGSPYE